MIFMRYIWFKLQANIARFHRPPVNGNNLHEKKNVRTNNSKLHRNEGVNSKSFASALNSHAPVHTKLDIPSPAMFGFPNVNVTYMGGMWVLLTFDDEGTKEKLLNHKGVNSWFSVINPYSDLFVCDERVIWVSIEGLPPKAMTQNTFARIVSAWGVVLDEEINVANLASKRLLIKTNQHTHIKDTVKVIIKGNVFWIRVKEVDSWSPSFKFSENYMSSENESVNEDNVKNSELHVNEEILEEGEVNHVSESSFTQENNLNHPKQPSINVPDPSSQDPFGIYKILNRNHVEKSPSNGDPKFPPGFTPDVVSEHPSEGPWLPTSSKLLIISVYAPQDPVEKRMLWDYLLHLIKGWEGEYVLIGDFNEVRSEHERFGTLFNANAAKAFNTFIAQANLIDLPLEGYSFTWFHTSASKMSKLDRFLVSEEGFDNLVRKSWSKPVHDEKNSMDRLKKKFQNIKANIKTWRKKGMCHEETLAERTKLQHRLYDLNSLISQDMAQKAKIHIRGVLVDGEWISETNKVRNEFLSHFSNRFSAPPSPRLRLESQFDKVLSQEQNDDLERPISKDEIKCAVWDCGTNKSPGPDGFTFEFIRKYWSIISVDIEDVVSHFFNTDTFSQGCNSSFIALIPKTQDAKLVKDFRPISLIGCIYKIVTKVLANRLCTIIPDLISDVQSAFVTNRQILDGPFILSELLSWYKQKKFQSLIFKVDFEKAFDSIRWDYLDEVLLNFGFGSKWRGWINGCLSSSMGSVLVNGSPNAPSLSSIKV
ncbi:RNA-directed DNA polymerase, eukaryota [Tanacetum coccineum]